jgi:flagellar motor switch protein FliM
VEVREHVDLSDARSDLPQDGLIAVLEDGGGARGLIALSHGTVDALVEVQTTGRVDPRNLPPRPVTRIDEALCRDFIDLSSPPSRARPAGWRIATGPNG